MPHTPGPWVIIDAADEITVHPAMREGTIATISSPNAAANARLIRAAPELLRALKQVLACLGDDTPFSRTARRVVLSAEDPTDA